MIIFKPMKNIRILQKKNKMVRLITNQKKKKVSQQREDDRCDEIKFRTRQLLEFDRLSSSSN